MLLVFLKRLVYILKRQAGRGKERERERERKKTTRLNQGHKPVVSPAPVFKLTKTGNAFGLNLKQQQVLNTSMCPLAAIKD